MDGIIIIIALLLGYYLGHRNQLKEDARRIKELSQRISKSPDIKILHKREPKSPEKEVNEELNKEIRKL